MERKTEDAFVRAKPLRKVGWGTLARLALVFRQEETSLSDPRTERRERWNGRAAFGGITYQEEEPTPKPPDNSEIQSSPT